MKPTILLLVLGSLVITSTSCDRLNCDPESVTTTFKTGQMITIDYDSTNMRNIYTIEDGDHLLFSFNHSGAQCDNVFDDEWGEILAFEIDKDATEFEFTDIELKDIKCFYQEYGAWVTNEHYEIVTGTISGVKTSDKRWNVACAISTPPSSLSNQTREVNFESTFNLE